MLNSLMSIQNEYKEIYSDVCGMWSMPSMMTEQYIQCFKEHKQESDMLKAKEAAINNPSRPKKCASSQIKPHLKA